MTTGILAGPGRILKPVRTPPVKAVQRNTVQFQDTVAANTRECFFTERFMRPILCETIRVSFAINTQRTLRIRMWATTGTTVHAIDGTHDLPVAGRNLMNTTGPQDYTTGDGQEGEIIIARNVRLPGGSFLCVDADNTDVANAHTVDVAIDVVELARGI